MTDIQEANVDWTKIKQILNEIINTLQPIVDMLPAGLPKVILSGIVSGLHLLVSVLPNS
jgi:hypothetical protein